jgi:pyruvate kinase
VEGRARILSKLEKPTAIEKLDEIVELSDAVMVARGDLGVELPPEDVPSVQKRIIRACRQAGKPVVVATQMLDSMIRAPVPTRAEASDVATAVYDSADAVMLSGETAVGQYPVEAVAMMERIISRVECDPYYRRVIEATTPGPEPTTADAICDALRNIAGILSAAATVTYTDSGFTSLRAARERPEAPILCLTPHISTARRLSMVWGVHSVQIEEVENVEGMVDKACRTAVAEGFVKPGQPLIIAAGTPFGTPGTTNILRIAWIEG